MPCGRKRPFMVTVFENSNFQHEHVTGSNARADDVHDDIQTAHNPREDCTHGYTDHEMVSTLEYCQNDVEGMQPAYRESDFYSTHLQKRHCQGLEFHNPVPVFTGICDQLEDQEMMVCEEYPPQEQRVEGNHQYTCNISQKPNNQSPASIFPINSFPLAGLNKAANTNWKPCAQCLAGQGGHINHIVER